MEQNPILIAFCHWVNAAQEASLLFYFSLNFCDTDFETILGVGVLYIIFSTQELLAVSQAETSYISQVVCELQMENFCVKTLKKKKKSSSLIHPLITLSFHHFLTFSAFLNTAELHSTYRKVLKNNKLSSFVTIFSLLLNYLFR